MKRINLLDVAWRTKGSGLLTASTARIRVLGSEVARKAATKIQPRTDQVQELGFQLAIRVEEMDKAVQRWSESGQRRLDGVYERWPARGTPRCLAGPDGRQVALYKLPYLDVQDLDKVSQELGVLGAPLCIFDLMWMGTPDLTTHGTWAEEQVENHKQRVRDKRVRQEIGRAWESYQEVLHSLSKQAKMLRTFIAWPLDRDPSSYVRQRLLSFSLREVEFLPIFYRLLRRPQDERWVEAFVSLGRETGDCVRLILPDWVRITSRGVIFQETPAGAPIRPSAYLRGLTLLHLGEMTIPQLRERLQDRIAESGDEVILKWSVFIRRNRALAIRREEMQLARDEQRNQLREFPEDRKTEFEQRRAVVDSIRKGEMPVDVRAELILKAYTAERLEAMYRDTLYSLNNDRIRYREWRSQRQNERILNALLPTVPHRLSGRDTMLLNLERAKPMLSFHGYAVPREAILIGREERTNRPVALAPWHTGHMGIIGMTTVGKSTLAQTILYRLWMLGLTRRIAVINNKTLVPGEDPEWWGVFSRLGGVFITPDEAPTEQEAFARRLQSYNQERYIFYQAQKHKPALDIIFLRWVQGLSKKGQPMMLVVDEVFPWAAATDDRLLILAEILSQGLGKDTVGIWTTQALTMLDRPNEPMRMAALMATTQIFCDFFTYDYPILPKLQLLESEHIVHMISRFWPPGAAAPFKGRFVLQVGKWLRDVHSSPTEWEMQLFARKPLTEVRDLRKHWGV